MKIDLPDREFAGHIFDCDGTIVDSMPLHFRAWTAAFEAHHSPYVFSELEFYQSAGMTETDVVAQLNAKHGADLDPEAVVKSKLSWFREHMHELQSVAAVEAIIRQVAEEGKAMSVASGSKLIIVEPELEIVGLRDLFSIIVTPEFVERGKPAPDMFLLAASKMGVSPEDCLVYEDGNSGIQAAEAAGMTSVYIPTADERLRSWKDDGTLAVRLLRILVRLAAHASLASLLSLVRLPGPCPSWPGSRDFGGAPV